jgi:hypothetical protein
MLARGCKHDRASGAGVSAPRLIDAQILVGTALVTARRATGICTWSVTRSVGIINACVVGVARIGGVEMARVTRQGKGDEVAAIGAEGRLYLTGSEGLVCLSIGDDADGDRTRLRVGFARFEYEPGCVCANMPTRSAPRDSNMQLIM